MNETTTKGQTMTADERLAEMRRRAQTTKPVDWAGVRRATQASPKDETEWALVDAFGE